MKRKITYWLLLFTVFFSPLLRRGAGGEAFAQFPYQQVVNSTGNDATAGGIHLTYSVGEPVIETTPLSGGIQLTQGFLQTMACPSIASFSVTPNDTICKGDNITIVPQFSPQGPYTYSWAPGGQTTTSISVSPTVTTTYTFVVFYTTNCGDTDSVTIHVSDPVASISPAPNDSICDGNSITLTANGTGGFAPYNYTWAPGGQLTQTITDLPSSTTTYLVSLNDKYSCPASATQTVEVLPNPVVSFTGGDSVFICSGGSAVITASGASSYTWAPAAGLSCTNCSNPTANPTSSTTYTVTGSTLGCAGTATVSVTVNPLPAITSTPPADTICIGSGTTLMASGGVSYSWSPGGNSTSSIIVSPTASTTYTVTGTDANGCTNTDTSAVTVGPYPSASMSASPATICAGSSATLTSNEPGNTYAWSPGGQATSAITVSPSITTAYSLTVTTPAGCSASGTLTISVNPTPTVTASADISICAGQGDTIFATVTGGNPAYTYSWVLAAGLNNTTISNPVANPITTTTYSVSVTDANGCVSNSDSVKVAVNPLPNITAASNTTICLGQSATLSAFNGTSYSWSPGGSTTSAIVVSPAIAGITTYTVTGTDATSCSNTATVSVTVNAPPTASIIGPATSICSGTNATLTATGGGTYLWNTLATTAIITDNPTGTTTYTVTVTNAAGCTDSATATVNVNPSPSVTLTLGGSSTLCAGDSVQITATASSGTPTYTYMWSPATDLSCSCSNPYASPIATTTYTLVVLDQNSCSDTASQPITVNSPPTAGITGTDSICAGQTATLTASGGGNYSWSPGGSTSAVITDNPTSLATYTVTVTDPITSCFDTATFSVAVLAAPTLTVSATQTFVCNGDSTILTATVSAAVTYVWSPGGQTTSAITVTPTANTTYTVSVNNGSCAADDSIAITVNPGPSVTVTSATNDSICLGNSATLTAAAAGGVSYSWWTSPAQTTASITEAPATSGSFTYSVTITDNNGCKGTGTFTLTVNPLPAASISGNDSICSGDATTLSASGGITYSWNTAANTSAITVNPTGTTGYTVTITDNNGCTDMDSIIVNVTAQPIASVTVAPGSTICSGTQVTLSASGGTTYSWSDGTQTATGSNINVSPTVTTTYTLVVANGSCSDTLIDSVVVNSVTAQITGNTSICIGDAATLTASGGTTYSWSTNQSITSIVVSPATTTNYTVAAFVGSCYDTATVTVNVGTPPTATITATAPSVCSGVNDTLYAWGGQTYLWSPGGQTTSSIIVTPVNSGTTQITVTYSVTAFVGACSHDTTITLTVNPLPAITASANPNTICPGDSTTLTASGGILYSWIPDSILTTSPTVTVSPSVNTIYIAVGANGFGCFNFDTAAVNISQISVNAGTDQTICPGSSAQLNASVSGNTSTVTYLWTPSAMVNDPAVPNPTASLDSATTFFAVEVSNQDGCYAKDTVIVFVNFVQECLEICNNIYHVITPNGDGDNDKWVIDGIPSFSDNTVSLFNRWGDVVWNQSGYDNVNIIWTGKNNKEEQLPSGTYFYVIELNWEGKHMKCVGWVEITR